MSFNYKHAQVTKEGLEKVKQLTDTLNGWEFSQEQDKVKIYHYKKTDPNAPVLVRGDTVFTNLPPGCTPQDIVTAANLAGCRKVWDDKYDKSEMKEFYSRYEALFWSNQKLPWPISPRDILGTCIQENNKEATYCSMVSVQDPQVPVISGTVRANVLVCGWKFHWTNDTIGLVYVNQVDLAGSLPTSFMKKLFLQIPLCAAKIRDFVTKYGFVPALRWVEESVVFNGEAYEHDSRKYTLDLLIEESVNGTAAEITCSSRMYPKGIQAQLKGEGQIEHSMDEYKNPRVILKSLKKGSKITLVITKKK